MKHTLHTMVFAAAAVMATAAIGSAQSMKAEIPFAFHAGRTWMQPGTYSVNVLRTRGGQPLLYLHSEEGRQNVITMPVTTYSEGAPSLNTVLRFACTEGSCELSQLRGADASVYQFRVSKNGPAMRLASVALRPDRAN